MIVRKWKALLCALELLAESEAVCVGLGGTDPAVALAWLRQQLDLKDGDVPYHDPPVARLFARLEAATGQAEWRFDVAKDTKLDADAVQLFSSPCVVTAGERRRVYFGSGLDNFARGFLYCIEE